jgi:putative ribosome biogenesis GTPase RsgA
LWRQVLLVFAMSMPPWDPQAITRFLVVAEASEIPVLVVLNKADLVPPQELDAIVQQVGPRMLSPQVDLQDAMSTRSLEALWHLHGPVILLSRVRDVS